MAFVLLSQPLIVSLLLLLVIVAEACAKTHSYCTTCRGPIHSWDFLPVSFHCGRPNTRGPTGLEWLPEDIEALSRYPLITLEKWHGSQAFSTRVCNETGNCNATNVFFWEQDAWVSAARQIKAVNANASIAVWMDTMLIYTGWQWPPPPKVTEDNLNRTLNPDVKVPCSTGYFRPAEFLDSSLGHDYLLKNASGLPALEPWSGCHVYDHSKPKVRRYWTELCLNMTSTGVIDGCGADFSAMEQNRWAAHTTANIAKALGLDMDVAKVWNEGHRRMMIDTTTALGDGILIGKDSFELGDHVNAVLQEGCPARNSTISMLRNLTATAKALKKRLVYQCHARGPTESVMAAFLCGAGPDHYFTVGGWINDAPGFPSHWNPAFEKPLGVPLSDAVYDAESATWSRTFASGTTARFDAKTNLGTITWKDSQQHTKVDLWEWKIINRK